MPRDERGRRRQTELQRPAAPASPLATQQRHVSISTPKRLGALVLLASIAATACTSSGASTAPSAAASTAASAAPSTAASAAPSTASVAPSTAASAAALTYRCTKGDGQLNGAGSTFIFPLLSKMGEDYNTKCGVKLNYQSIGSGGGVKQWTENTVDFGASDAYLADSEITAAAKRRSGRGPGDVRCGRGRLQPSALTGALR